MNINDLPELLKQLENRAGEQKEFKAALLEISTSMAEILAQLEKNGPELAKAIAKELRGLRINAVVGTPDVTVNVKAPQVTVEAPKVNVQAPSVTVNVPDINVPAAVVHVMPSPPGTWEFDVRPGQGGAFKMTARKV